MADHHDGGRPASVPVTPAGHHQTRTYETGESSATGSLRYATPTTERNSTHDDSPNIDSSPAGASRHLEEHATRDGRVRRRNRHRSGGAFLLQDPADRNHSTRHRTRSTPHHKRKGQPRTPEKPQSSHVENSATARGSSVPLSDASTASPATQGSGRGRISTADDERRRVGGASPSPSGLDVDSTQIVNMALNLSESRRVASRRNVSRTNPPRLVPLPDSGSKSNLRQHFQQQRKTSRTGSPRPGQVPSPRIPSSSFKPNSPLQGSFDAAQDPHFSYQFSASTLARAQKAKEHLELMAEYRRVLEHVPPLKPGHDGQPAASPSSSPGVVPRDRQVVLGRPYNPLQYVRNRKVRTRERKVIDGEQQGFGDVECVRAWVDRVCQWNSGSGTDGVKNSFTLPPFPGADDADGQASPEPASKQALRARRPRVDWFFDPCDMIADAYWLEQDHHKQLIEDRLWRKIFPAVPNAPPRPTSRQFEELDLDPGLWSARTTEPDETPGQQDIRLVHTEDGTPGSTRERAKQKFHDMKGFHHRHTSSIYGSNDFLRMRRESMSDASGSDGDLRVDSRRRAARHGRRETITSGANDLLQKQMMDALAQEAKEKELASVPETEKAAWPDCTEPSVPLSPQRVPNVQQSSRSHSRKTSVADLSDSDTRANASRSRLASPARFYRRGRPSLDIPEDPSREYAQHSVPSSPKLEDARDYAFPSHSGVNISVVSSRSGSPTRNPLSKVRRRLRDKSRSRDLGPESQSDLDDDVKQYPTVLEPPSPSEKLAPRTTDESHKSHRSSNSMRMHDDQAAGLRGLFRSPRIDTVIRDSVSKLGDIIWRKDASESESESEESDAEDGRGRRRRPSMNVSRRGSRRPQDEEQQQGVKHFYDIMPQFQHVDESRSRQAAKWEQLKPPRIDVSGASPTSSPSRAPIPQRHGGDAAGSESESHSNGVSSEGVHAAGGRLNAVIGAPPILGQTGRAPSRQWSITDRTPFPEKQTKLSKREIARVRALILSSGIKAKEINRRANELHRPLCKESLELARTRRRSSVGELTWVDIAELAPECKELHEQQVSSCDIYPLASRALGMAIQASGQRWQASADRFTSDTTPRLQRRIWEVRSRLTDELSQMTRRATDEADEASNELALDQPLKVKHVVDVIEKLLRKRRRRFRWLRRAMWLAVEWVLVGFMWYVWFVVMMLRIFLGVSRGVWGGVRWLLWL